MILHLDEDHRLALRIMSQETGLPMNQLIRWGIRLLWEMHRRKYLSMPWRFFRLAHQERDGKRKPTDVSAGGSS